VDSVLVDEIGQRVAEQRHATSPLCIASTSINVMRCTRTQRTTFVSLPWACNPDIDGKIFTKNLETGATTEINALAAADVVEQV
jgi:hypothetical protein